MILSVSDQLSASSRRKTPEGFLRARAVLTKPGIFEYDASELGVGEKGQRVRVNQTKDSVFHADTLDSARGAAVTFGHPDESLNPKTWKQRVVGSVFGEPKESDDGLAVEVLIGDGDTISAIESGRSQLSIGKDVVLDKAPHGVGYEYETKGGISINHVAVVQYGRAGPNVRVLDSKPGGTGMTKEEIQEAVRVAVKDCATPASADAKGLDMDLLIRKIGDSLAPISEKVQQLVDERSKAIDEKRKASLVDASKKLEDAAYRKGLADERARLSAMQDALKLIPQEQHRAIMDKPVHDVLVAAVGDSVTNAHEQGDDFLRGVVAMKLKAQDEQQGSGGGGEPYPYNPHTAPAAPNQLQDRSAASDEYQKRLDKIFEESGGIL